MTTDTNIRGSGVKNKPMIGTVLGMPIHSTDKWEVLRILKERVETQTYDKPLFVVTAYSEFFLKRLGDDQFAQALDRADVVVADGVSVTAALDYGRFGSEGVGRDLVRGLVVGLKVIVGKYSHRITGVDLVRHILSRSDCRVLLVGGFDDVARRVAKKFGAGNPKVNIDYLPAPVFGDELPEKENEMLIAKINEFKPDILFVALGQYKQEKWIAANVQNLKTKVVMGVGSTFDELMGDGIWGQPVPGWIEKMGLKWLWRAMRDPKHWKRAWRAAVVFPWTVFRQTGK